MRIKRTLLFTTMLISLMIIGIIIYRQFRIYSNELEKASPTIIHDEREIMIEPDGTEFFINRVSITLKEGASSRILYLIISLFNGEIITSFPEINYYEIELLNCRNSFNYDKKACLEEQEKVINSFKQNPDIEDIRKTPKISLPMPLK